MLGQLGALSQCHTFAIVSILSQQILTMNRKQFLKNFFGKLHSVTCPLVLIRNSLELRAIVLNMDFGQYQLLHAATSPSCFITS